MNPKVDSLHREVEEHFSSRVRTGTAADAGIQISWCWTSPCIGLVQLYCFVVCVLDYLTGCTDAVC